MKKLKSITINSYNKTAEEYNKTVTDFDMVSVLGYFMDLLTFKSKILDLGCGPGHHSKVFSENNFDVTGIDLSSEMINIAKREIKTANFRIMDISSLSFLDNSFNGIWASASLLHIPKDELSSILIKLHSILTDKGVLYLSLKKGFGSEIIQDERYRNVDKFYVFYQPEEINNILTNVGFNVVSIKENPKREFYDTNPWIHIFCKK